MATEIEIKARVDALNRALGTGVRSVTLGGQTTTFGTVEALIKARDDALSQLAAITPGARRPKQTRLVFAGRGYNND